MDQPTFDRPTSGASAAVLADQLREARARTRLVTDEPSSNELMGHNSQSSARVAFGTYSTVTLFARFRG